MPYLRDMDGYIYIKEEMGGLLMGGFEPHAKTWGLDGIPEEFEYTQLQEDWDQMELFMKSAMHRVPQFENAGISSLTTVPESFTPDTSYMLGEAPGVKNFFVACGMNSVGITSAGGGEISWSAWGWKGPTSRWLTWEWMSTATMSPMERMVKGVKKTDVPVRTINGDALLASAFANRIGAPGAVSPATADSGAELKTGLGRRRQRTENRSIPQSIP